MAGLDLMEVWLGDCLELMQDLPDNSLDAVVTDPPYGLSFMGKKWDYDVPSVEIWREALRVLKPGGHLLSFGGTRTSHRMVVNIEDAGFEIRDQLQWIYGSGFPKSLDISKAIDKASGAKRAVIGSKDVGPDIRGDNFGRSEGGRMVAEITAPATDDAKVWDGWGTALKPANEPICLARKPLEKGLTVAQNVLKWGTGGLNIEGSRIGAEPVERGRVGRAECESEAYGKKLMDGGAGVSVGRWPANVLFDEAAAEMLDTQSGDRPAGYRKNPSTQSGSKFQSNRGAGERGFKDSGGASRFFYVAKASKSERNAGLERGGNNHPTVKPVKLMEYLIRLVTPPGGIVLDPFAGSGTTGVAAKRLGREFLGFEKEAEYVKIAKKRIKGTK